MQVNILEAKNRLSQLIKFACAGEDVVIANRGEPVARLIPADEASQTDAGGAQAILNWLARHPLPDYARRSAVEIDAGIAEERTVGLIYLDACLIPRIAVIASEAKQSRASRTGPGLLRSARNDNLWSVARCEAFWTNDNRLTQSSHGLARNILQ